MKVGHRILVPLALAAALAGGVTLAPAALGPRYGGEVTVTVPSVPASLDPAAPRAASHLLALGLVHDRLVDLDASGTLQPRLAAAWERELDGRQWLVTLRAGRCHDDRPVTAEAVEASIRRFVRSSSAAGAAMASSLEGGSKFRRGATEELPGVVVASERGVRLRFVAVLPAPLAPLASWAASITSVAGAPCGPFRVPVTPSPGNALALVASQGHWAGRPFLDRVILTTADPTLPRSEAPEGDDAAAVHLGSGDPTGPSQRLMLWLDPQRGPFSARAARQALAACDWASLAERFVPEGSPLVALLPGWSAAPPGATGATPAQRVAAQDDVSLVVASDVPEKASQRVVAQMLALGHRPRVGVVPPGSLMTTEGDAHLGYWLPDVAEASLIVRQAAEMVGSREVETACGEANAVPDPAQRLAAVRKAEEDLLADGATIPLAWAPLTMTVDQRLRDAEVDDGGRLALENAWLAP